MFFDLVCCYDLVLDRFSWGVSGHGILDFRSRFGVVVDYLPVWLLLIAALISTL